MRIIQTFWSGSKQNILDSSYGWHNPIFHIMGWVLSSNLLSKLYNELELYTDKKGYEILIKKLKLPYTKVHVVLDELNVYDSDLWALSKIYVYSLQKEPFIHIDGDVFIWRHFGKELINGKFITQNIEFGTEYYNNIWGDLKKGLEYFPKEILDDRKKSEIIKMYNFGVFGSKDLEFIKTYTEKAFDFVDKNISSLKNINITNFNIFFEQYLFYCLTKKEPVSCLFTEHIGDNQYKGFADFEDVPVNKKYLHLLGNYKRDFISCRKLSKQLLIEFPKEYLKVLELFENKQFKTYNSIIKNTGFIEFKSFSEYYQSASRIEKYPRTKEILRVNLKITLEEIEIIFQSEKRLVKEVKNLKNETFTAVYNYEKSIIEYLNSLTNIDVYNLCKSSYENSKLYLSYLNNTRIYLHKKTAIALEKSLSPLIDDNPLFFIGEDITKNFTRIITPTLEQPYYIELVLDELDEMIYRETINSIKPNQLLKNLEKYFDLEDIKGSRSEYENLILNKIKTLVYNNVIDIEN